MGGAAKEKGGFGSGKNGPPAPSQSNADGASNSPNEVLPLDQEPEDEGLMRNNQTLGHDEDDVYYPAGQSSPHQN